MIELVGLDEVLADPDCFFAGFDFDYGECHGKLEHVDLLVLDGGWSVPVRCCHVHSRTYDKFWRREWPSWLKEGKHGVQS